MGFLKGWMQVAGSAASDVRQGMMQLFGGTKTQECMKLKGLLVETDGWQKKSGRGFCSGGRWAFALEEILILGAH